MDIKIELNSAGIRELLKSGELKSLCEEKAGEIQSRCGDGYVTTSGTGKSRAYANVKTGNAKAYYSNLKHNTILKNMRG